MILFSILTFTFTTFAWFSDSVTSNNNIITVGNLDVEMYWTENLSSDEWHNIEDPAHNEVFSHDNYEPGYTDVKYLKIVNAGSLAFKYDLSLLPIGEVGELAEVVDVYYLHNVSSNIYGIGRRDDVGLYSKYIERKKRFVAESLEDLLNVFQQIRDGEEGKPILYICSDQYLSLLLHANIDFEKYFTLAGSDFSVLRIINDKNSINLHCLNIGINIPFAISFEQAVQDPSLEFPVIVKWNEKRLNEKENPVGKVHVCDSREDLDKLNERLMSSGISTGDFFVQQYISGSNLLQHSVGGYYHNGEPLAQVVVIQNKQYPQGISAQVVMVPNEYEDTTHLRQATNQLARSFNFTGFLEAEYKLDLLHNDIYLLDINPRPWGWVSLLGAVYPDFHLVFHDEKPSPVAPKAVWKSNLRCLLSAKNPNNPKISFDFKGYTKASDIYDPKDKMPSLMIYLMALKKIIKRFFHHDFYNSLSSVRRSCKNRSEGFRENHSKGI
jgi:predicted ribosomally synthesized peptide with SipW-like signal peptide